jgi:tetratricopeptide (TPR) repeat protein/transcriptional regulator with XRE-family HTH domain
MDSQSNLGAVLRRRRAESGVTQEELAERCGLSVRAISDIERGVTGRPRRASVELIADALGLSATDLDELGGGRRTGGTGGTGGEPESAIPRQLPAAVRNFAGRSAELRMLTDLLWDPAAANAVVITAVSGTAGVGKTALALHWAHQSAEHFPDGQLYVNLRGFDASPPISAGDALAGFLRALGACGREIPAELDERAARFRSMLAGRRVLVLLDNAVDVRQVRPLLPGNPTCAVVVTSRNRLVGLVARDGARRVELDLLPLDDAVGLLRSLVGERVAAEPDAAVALAGQCSRLPLALRVAAELATSRTGSPLAELVDELADEQRRLDLLDAEGDAETAVRAVFSWSYRHLDPAAARAFRLLGLQPGADIDVYGAAALIGDTLKQTSGLLDQLARAYLIHQSRPGRWAMHDLLRAYAAEQARHYDGETSQRDALTRLFDCYLATATAAVYTAFPSENRYPRRTAPGPAIHPRPLADPAVARAWLDSERANLVAVVGTARHGWPDHSLDLATVLFRYLENCNHYPEAQSIYTQARGAARQLGDQAAECSALTNLGAVDARQGRYAQAFGHFRLALRLCRQTGDPTAEARALTSLGVISWHRGNYRQAAGHLERAAELFSRTGKRTGQAYALGNLGLAALRLGRCEEAASHLELALSLFGQAGDPGGEAWALVNLGDVNVHRCHYRLAAGNLNKALALFRELGNTAGEAHALSNLGDVGRQEGRYLEATGHFRQALVLFRAIADRAGQAEALNGLGEVALATGKSARALAQHSAALDLASQIGELYEQARAHRGIAEAHLADGDGDGEQARQHWQQALKLYTGLGVPEADQVRDLFEPGVPSVPSAL